MKSLIKPLRDISFLTTALALALMANFAYGQWANPTQTPPQGNTAAPLNVSVTDQIKVGNITSWQLKAGNQMWSPEYCDENGQNCVSSAGIVPAPPTCTGDSVLQWNGSSWSCATGVLASGTVSTQEAKCYGQGGSDFSSAGYYQSVCNMSADNACGMVSNCARNKAQVYGYFNMCKWTCSYNP